MNNIDEEALRNAVELVQSLAAQPKCIIYLPWEEINRVHMRRPLTQCTEKVPHRYVAIVPTGDFFVANIVDNIVLLSGTLLKGDMRACFPNTAVGRGQAKAWVDQQMTFLGYTLL
jgi:hypothetical protein